MLAGLFFLVPPTLYLECFSSSTASTSGSEVQQARTPCPHVRQCSMPIAMLHTCSASCAICALPASSAVPAAPFALLPASPCSASCVCTLCLQPLNGTLPLLSAAALRVHVRRAHALLSIFPVVQHHCPHSQRRLCTLHTPAVHTPSLVELPRSASTYTSSKTVP